MSCSSAPCELKNRFTVFVSNLQPDILVPCTKQELLTPVHLLQVTGDVVSQNWDSLLLEKLTFQTRCKIRNLSQVIKEQMEMFQEVFRGLPGLSCFCLLLQQVLLKLSHPSESIGPAHGNTQSHSDMDKAECTKADTSLRNDGPWAFVDNWRRSGKETGLFSSQGKGQAADHIPIIRDSTIQWKGLQSRTPGCLGSRPSSNPGWLDCIGFHIFSLGAK